LGTLAISHTSTGEDWDGENIYRMHGSSQYGLIKKVEEDGTTTTLGTLTGGSWIYTVGLAYDWVNDDGTWYFLHINNQISNPDVTNLLEYKIYEGSAELGAVPAGTTTFVTNQVV